MIANAIKKGQLNQDSIFETLLAVKRSGASAIITYFALEAAKRIKR